MGITGNGWMCPKNFNSSLLGSPLTLSRKTLRIRVVPCNIANQTDIKEGDNDGNITCAPDEEIT